MDGVLRAGQRWLLFFLLLLSAACSRETDVPVAKHGAITIDAPHSDMVVPLGGEWAFYWNRLVTPAAFAMEPKPNGYLKLPGRWNDFTIDGKPVGPYGLATLRLTVHSAPGARTQALHLPTITRAYRLWVDGKLVSTRGVIGRDPLKEGGAPSADIVHFETDGRPIDIVLQVSNHYSFYPPMTAPITIGPTAKIEMQKQAPMRRTLFLAGGLAMIAFFCLTVFAFRRDDRSQAYFGLFVLVWALLITVQYDREFWLVEVLGPGGTLALGRAEYILFYMSLPLACAFFQSLYPRHISAIQPRLATAVFLPLALVSALIPYLWLRSMAYGAYAAIGLLLTFLAYQVIRAALRDREGAAFVLAGFAVLACAGLVDMAKETNIIAMPYLVMPFGILAFALLQALHMSYRSVRTLQKVENLSAELDTKNQALECKIRETERLSRQIVCVSEEERRRISQDLHDGICQQLTAARLRFSVLRKQIQDPSIEESEVATLSSLLEEAVNQAYDMSLGLWPVDTGTAELSTSFEELCRRIGRMENMTVTFRRSLRDCDVRSSEVNRQLYRIAQEALANVVKHAKATKVEVSLICTPQAGVVLTVVDDGVGLSDRTVSKDGAGLGMRIMEHRAALIGGTLVAEDGRGTVISCVIPCSQNVGCPIRKEACDA